MPQVHMRRRARHKTRGSQASHSNMLWYLIRLAYKCHQKGTENAKCCRKIELSLQYFPKITCPCTPASSWAAVCSWSQLLYVVRILFINIIAVCHACLVTESEGKNRKGTYFTISHTHAPLCPAMLVCHLSKAQH